MELITLKYPEWSSQVVAGFTKGEQEFAGKAYVIGIYRTSQTDWSINVGEIHTVRPMDIKVGKPSEMFEGRTCIGCDGKGEYTGIGFKCPECDGSGVVSSFACLGKNQFLKENSLIDLISKHVNVGEHDIITRVMFNRMEK